MDNHTDHAAELRAPTEAEIDRIMDALTPAQLLALAKTGLDAVIDEATGFQEVRSADALNEQYRRHAGAHAPRIIQQVADAITACPTCFGAGEVGADNCENMHSVPCPTCNPAPKGETT
jgi:hypothetical protein